VEWGKISYKIEYDFVKLKECPKLIAVKKHPSLISSIIVLRISLAQS